MRLVFFGTPSIAAEVLEYLIEHRLNIVAVISKPDKAQGRSATLQPVPVKLIAQKYNIQIYQPEKVSAEEFLPTLRSFDADLFVVVAYGEILKQHVLDCPKKACINLHASLLPKYRGAAPIQRAIMNGEQETGVTIMHMVRKMDAGEILSQVKTPIGPDMTAGELQNALSRIGQKALLEVIQQFAAGTPPITPQDEAQATMAHKIELEDCQVYWNQPASQLHNLIRAVNPEPGAWCNVQIATQTKRLRLFASRAHPEISLPIGQMHFEAGKLLIGTIQGSLELLEVQLEGKKRLPAADFYRGIPKGTLLMQ